MSAITLEIMSWFLNYAIHSSVVIGAIWFFTRLWPSSSSAIRNALWRVAVFAPVFTSLVWTLTPHISLFNPMELNTSAKIQRHADPLGLSGLQAALVVKDTLEQRQTPNSNEMKGVPPSQGRYLALVPQAAWELESSAQLERSEERLVPSASSIALMLAGVALLGWSCFSLARGGLQIVSLRRHLADRSLVEDPELLGVLARLQQATKCTRRVRLSSHDSISSPIALVGDEICVPTRMIHAMPLAQSKAAIAHELAHIRRKDPIWTLCIHIVESMFPMQPLNRLARIQHNATMELLCDDWAIQQTGEGLNLAKCLETIGQWSQKTSHPEMCPAMARPSQALVARVRHALSDDAGTLPQRAGRLAGITTALCLGSLVALTPSFAPASSDVQEPSESLDEVELFYESSYEQQLKTATKGLGIASTLQNALSVALADEVASHIPKLPARSTQGLREPVEKSTEETQKSEAVALSRGNRTQSLPLIDELVVGSRIVAQVKIDPKAKRSELSIAATQAQLQRLVVTRRKGRLSLSMERGYRNNDKTPVRVTLTTRALRSIDVSGASSLDWTGQNDTSTLEIDLSGSVRVTGSVKTRALTLNLSGASKLSLNGSSKAVRMDTSGASVVDLAKLDTVDMRVESSGASSASTCTRGSLVGRLSGASVVRERCEPKTTNVRTSGASRVVTK